jgi:K+-transporting ATPase ATPase A chain
MPLERVVYRWTGIDPESEMTWRRYALHLLTFNGLGFCLLFALLHYQAELPLNPDGLGPVPLDLAFNTAVSFVTNTNWQAYAGEITLSPLTQMLGLGVQNFLSAATGLAVLFALVRGLTRVNTETVGNFWVDLSRSTLYVLLPLSFLLALGLASQGVVQTFEAPVAIRPLEAATSSAPKDANLRQVIPLGPVASQIAIKQLGTNGGGYYNTNSAHPFENPTAFSNLLELLAILLIPAATCFMFGNLVGDIRQGLVLLGAMCALFAPMCLLVMVLEQDAMPWMHTLGLDLQPSDFSSGGQMEGKEVRFGIAASALWAVATTAASNGSVNAMLDSFTPLGGMIPLWLMQLGEVIFGGVGSGLYGMVVFAVVAVFIAGLMIGRTPEYLGKKIEAFEIKMAALVILLPPFLVLFGTAIGVEVPSARSAILNPGPHGFTEILYAFSSAGNNNGSAFAGLSTNTPFFNDLLGVLMLGGRFGLMVPVLALAGSFARKKRVPPSSGTLATHTPLFLCLLIITVVVVGALTFIPALALGPIVEQLQLFTR